MALDPHSPQLPNLSAGEIRKIIEQAKNGSLFDLREVPKIMNSDARVYSTYHAEIMDAVFSHLRPISMSEEFDSDSEAYHLSCAAFSAIAHIILWYRSELKTRPRSPAVVNTTARLFKEARNYAERARQMITLGSSVSAYALVVVCFKVLCDNVPELEAFLSSEQVMLDFAVAWWATQYCGVPPIYPDNNRAASKEEDGDAPMVLFGSITERNAKGLARTVMDGRVCDPEVFVQRTIQRMKSLLQLNKLDHLKHLPNNTLEIVSMECAVISLDHLIKAEPSLGRLVVLIPGALRAIVSCLVIVSDRLYKEELPTDEDGFRKRVRRLMRVVIMARLVVDWATDNTNRIASNVRILLEAGLFRILGNAAPFLGEVSGMQHTTADMVFCALAPYALFPGTMGLFIREFHSSLNPRLRRLPAVSSTNRIGYMGSTAQGLIPLRDLHAKAALDRLCDNMKVNTHQGGELICSRCHLVSYCSKECQRQDWKVFHRHECPSLLRLYRDGKATRSLYPYRYRKLHVNILRYAFESVEHIARSAAPKEPLKVYDPIAVQISVPVLFGEEKLYMRKERVQFEIDEYERRTIRCVPPYLMPRFQGILLTFRGWVTRLKLATTESSVPSRFAVGSLRMIEHSFHFGSVDAVVILLLEQVAPISISSGKGFEFAKKVRDFGRRGPTAKSSYEVVASIAFMRPHDRSQDRYRQALGAFVDDIQAQIDKVYSPQ
ncbi:hypothetical protein NMY22_g9743 [Coprinellus aureogranulatus]|nr:hypothetical protein NMY22_g9743 [Coprinellus aureogranulatus]